MDINDLWKIENPFELLQKVSAQNGIKSIEPRLIGENAKNTIFASCRVAIYDSETKKQLGFGGGETVENALEIASLDALAKFTGTHNLRPFNWKITPEECFATKKTQKRLNAVKK